MRASRRELLFGLALALATSLFVLEAMATVWLAFANGGLFQLKPKASSASADLSATPSPTRSIAVLNPYFGYSLRPGITVERMLGARAPFLFDAPDGPVWTRVKHVKASQLGMWNEKPIPYVPNADEKVVGVFGASVAAWLVLQAGDRLAAGLANAAPGKRIVLLNFGLPAGKQPQQLLILSYLVSLGQHFDLVINIDGFGELVFGSNNVDENVDFTMPSIHMTKPLWHSADTERHRIQDFSLLMAHMEANDRSATIARWRSYNRSAAIEMVLGALQTHFDAKAQTALLEIVRTPVDAANEVYVMPRSREASGTDALPHIAEHWRRSSSAMALISNGVGAGYLHVLGPSPFAGSRHFSHEELAIVQPDNPMSRQAAVGFPFLLARPPDLVGERAAYVTATSLFDHTPEQVYADAVHQNILGAGILGDFIAREANSRGLLR